MLRPDAIKLGLIKPTKAEIEQMGLTGEDLSRPDQAFNTADEGKDIEAIIDLGDLTYKELKKKAEEMGIELGSKYINKDALVELIRAKI